MKKYIYTIIGALALMHNADAQQEKKQERRVIIIRKGTMTDSVAGLKEWENYRKAMEAWNDTVRKMTRPLPQPPLLPLPPGFEDETRIFIDTPGLDSAGSRWIEKRIIIRDMEEGGDQPADIPLKASRVLNMSEMNLGFARIDQTGIGAGMMPELSTARSIHIGLGQDWGLKLGAQGKVRFWAGLRYDILNYRFEDARVRLQPRSNEFSAMVDSGSATSKSKVVINYLGVPLALGYQSNPRDPEDGFSIKAGVSAGYRVRTHTKVKFDNDRKEKEFDDFNFNDFLISPFVQLTYNSFGIYFRMNTSPVFKDGQGLATTGMQFGVVLQ